MNELDKAINNLGNMKDMVAVPPEVALPIFSEWYCKVFERAGGFEKLINKLISDIEDATGKKFDEATIEENLKGFIEVNNRYNERGMII
jgi:hypothetical protein